MRGGAPRVVWFTGEADPRTVSARSLAADLTSQGMPPHLVWNPCTAETLQLIPATRAGCLLPGAVGAEGRLCLQIMVVGTAREPFTNTPLKGLETIMAWLEEWRVARRWPAGPPLPAPHSYQAVGHRRPWARGGHFGASQVPETDRPDPGGLDIRRITGQETPVAEIPRPRNPAEQEASPGPPAAMLRPSRRLPRVAEPVLAPGH